MAIKVAGQTVVDDNRRITGVTDDLPSIRPTLNLDFANSKQLDPRINFTRSSTATYWDGKTTAKAEENLNPDSENLYSWSGWYASSSVNVTTAPDGTTTADKITSTTTDTIQSTYKFYTNGALSNKATTYSIYLKAAGYNYGFFGLVMNSGGIDTGMVVNLTTGSITDTFQNATGARGDSTFSVQSVGNGWYRCIISCTNVTYSTNSGFSAGPSNSATPTYNIGVPRFLGDGTSGTYIWGAQVEHRDSVTAYTPTTSTPITRYQPVLQTASANQPRFDHDPVTGESKGLLIEEARTNLNPWSENHSTWAYSANITKVGTAISPSGENNAVAVKGNGSAANIYINASVVAQTAGTTYTVSVWAKRLSGTPSTTGNIISAQYFIDGSGTVGRANIAIANLTDSWQRYSVTFTSQYTGPAMGHFFAADTDSESEVIAIWGIQMEAGSFPTSYIPTSGSQVTRAWDKAVMEDTPFISQVKGTFYTDVDLNGVVKNVGGADDRRHVFSLYPTTGGITAGWFTLYYDYNSADILMYGNATNNYNTVAYTGTGVHKATASYDSTEGGFVETIVTADGSINTNTPSSPRTSTFGKLEIGHGASNPNRPLSGYIRKISYYPDVLPNATLQAMTEV